MCGGGAVRTLPTKGGVGAGLLLFLLLERALGGFGGGVEELLLLVIATLLLHLPTLGLLLLVVFELSALGLGLRIMLALIFLDHCLSILISIKAWVSAGDKLDLGG